LEDPEYHANRIQYVTIPLDPTVAQVGGSDVAQSPINGKRDNSTGSGLPNGNFNGQDSLPQTSQTGPNDGTHPTPPIANDEVVRLQSRLTHVFGRMANLRGQLDEQIILTQELVSELEEAHKAISFYGNLTNHGLEYYNKQFSERLYAKLKRAGPSTRVLKFSMPVPPQFWKLIDIPNKISITELKYSRTVFEKKSKIIQTIKKTR